jgi:DNA-binding transcriptional ArsR family regulator
MNEVFEAIAHPIRREILKRLREGPRTAGEIADGFTISKPSISHHLNALKDAGLIYGERSGTSIVYHLNLSVFEELMAAVLDLWKGGAHAPDTEE